MIGSLTKRQEEAGTGKKTGILVICGGDFNNAAQQLTDVPRGRCHKSAPGGRLWTPPIYHQHGLLYFHQIFDFLSQNELCSRSKKSSKDSEIMSKASNLEQVKGFGLLKKVLFEAKCELLRVPNWS